MTAFTEAYNYGKV